MARARPLAFVVALVLGSGALVACGGGGGGGGEDLTGYFRSLERVTGGFRQGGLDLTAEPTRERSTPQPGQSPDQGDIEALGDAVDQYIELFSTFLREVAAVTPPETAADEHAEMAASVGDLLNLLHDLEGDIQDATTLAEAEERLRQEDFTEAQQGVVDACERLAELAGGAGIEAALDCDFGTPAGVTP